MPEPTIERPEPSQEPQPPHEPSAPEPTPTESRPTGQKPTSPTVPPDMRSSDFLRKYFRVPDIKLQPATSAISLVPGGTPFFGAPTKPQALTDAEWTEMEKARAALDALFDGKQPLKPADIDKAQKAIAQQTTVWAKAVSSPNLTPLQRYQLRVKLPTLPAPPGRGATPTLPGASANWLPQPPALDPSVTPTVHPLGPWLGEQFSALAEGGLDTAGEALAEHVLGKESSYGDFLGVARIAVAYKQEGPSSAVAEAANWLVGQIEMPQAGFAVWGGRFVAGLASHLLDNTMTQAYAAVGLEYDPEKDWAELRRRQNVWVNGYLDFFGFPKGKEE